MARSLRVAVLFARPADYPAYDAEGVWGILAEALEPLARAERLTYRHILPANESSLRAQLVDCDVLHVVAYSRDARQRRLGSVVLEGHDGHGRAVTPQYLAKLVTELVPGCCVVLQGPPGFEGAHDVMPRALVQHGVRAALSVDPTTPAAAQFYAGLSRGGAFSAAASLAQGWVRAFCEASESAEPTAAPTAEPSPLTAKPSRASTVVELDVPAPAAVDPLRAQLEAKRLANRFDVFLCHNHIDKPEVRRVAQMLTERGILPWLDEWELRPGMPWQRLLEEQIGSIASAAVFVGADGLGPWQRQEIDALLREFVQRNSAVIPVLLVGAARQPELPRFLRAMTWVDFRQSEAQALERLHWGITGNRVELERLMPSRPRE